MIQFLSNFVSSFDITNFIYFLFYIIESYLFITLLLSIFNVKSTHMKKFLCVLLIISVSTISSKVIPSPFNVILNYCCVSLLVTFIFSLNILKSFTSLMITSFIFGLLNIFLENHYLDLLNISPDAFINTPIYRIPYLILLYSSLVFIIIFSKKFRKIKFSLDWLDSLDKRTIAILCLDLVLGFLTLFFQLLITAYYLEIVPLIISISNFVLLVAFFILSLYSFTHIIKLASTQKDLEYAEEYNKSLQILYDKVSGFKHDFDSIIFYLNGYIEADDMSGLKQYFDEVKKDYKIAHNLSLINQNIINNPGIYSLLNNEYFKASTLGITFDIDVSLNINSLNINMYKFSRVLGILIDNAIEASEKCDDKIVQLSFIRENHNSRSIISIKNTYSNKNVNIREIFEKGMSSKKEHFGIGLWEVRRYVKKSKNLDLKTIKTEKFFIQNFYIYDS